MKYSFVLAALYLSAIAAAPASAQLRTPSCADNLSYMITPSGACIDLTAFTKLSQIRGKIAEIEKQQTPLVFNKLKLRQEGKNIYYLDGTVTNQSKTAVRIMSFQVDFTRQIDGNTVVVKSAQIPFARAISPGKSAVVEYPLMDKTLSEGMNVVFKDVETL